MCTAHTRGTPARARAPSRASAAAGPLQHQTVSLDCTVSLRPPRLGSMTSVSTVLGSMNMLPEIYRCTVSLPHHFRIKPYHFRQYSSGKYEYVAGNIPMYCDNLRRYVTIYQWPSVIVAHPARTHPALLTSPVAVHPFSHPKTAGRKVAADCSAGSDRTLALRSSHSCFHAPPTLANCLADRSLALHTGVSTHHPHSPTVSHVS